MLRESDLISVRHIHKINFGNAGKKKYKGISIDSRKVKRDEIFFAIKGENHDGHIFLADVFKKGVETVVINKSRFDKDKSISRYRGKKILVVRDTIKALGEFARIHKRNFKAGILCIAGSNGKTTTKDLTAAVLSKKFNVLKTEGNLNNHIGLPMTLLKLNSSHTFCVLEAGASHFGELRYLCEIAEPDFGLVTNIGKEHLEFFKNVRGVAKAEFELYDYLKNKENKICFLNIDDKFINKYSGGISDDKKFTYSYKSDTDVKGRFKGYNENYEPEIEIKSAKKEFKTSISTFGQHSVYNGLAAAAVGLYFKVETKKIKSALQNFIQESSKRMEIIRTGGVTIINDTYNSNPESVRMGLQTMMDFKTKGKKFAVLSDMLELGKASKREHREIGKFAAAQGIINLYTFGKESYSIFKSASKIKNNLYFDKKADLITMLKKTIKANDVIYVKGSRGMKMEEVVNAISEK